MRQITSKDRARLRKLMRDKKPVSAVKLVKAKTGMTVKEAWAWVKNEVKS